MLKKLGQAALIGCLATSSFAGADDRNDQQGKAAPQALSDAELDSITASGPTIIISNPGKGEVSMVDNPNRFICINCGGPSDTTNGVIITPSGKFIVIPGGPL